MDETTNQTAEATDSKAIDANPPVAPAAALLVEPIAPAGFSGTMSLQFIGGHLHQYFENGHAGVEPAGVWVPVPGTSVPSGLLAHIESMIKAHLGHKASE